MAKYRLIWERDGALDLSQVLDDRGKPILLTEKGAFVTVDAAALQHPVVKRYLGSGLKQESLEGTPPVTPASPAAAPTSVKATPPSAPEPKPEPAPIVATPKPEPVVTPEPVADTVPEAIPPVLVKSEDVEEADIVPPDTDSGDDGDATEGESDETDTGDDTEDNADEVKAPARKRGNKRRSTRNK